MIKNPGTNVMREKKGGVKCRMWVKSVKCGV